MGFGVWGLGFRAVQGLGLRVYKTGLEVTSVWGLRVRSV